MPLQIYNYIMPLAKNVGAYLGVPNPLPKHSIFICVRISVVAISILTDTIQLGSMANSPFQVQIDKSHFKRKSLVIYTLTATQIRNVGTVVKKQYIEFAKSL